MHSMRSFFRRSAVSRKMAPRVCVLLSLAGVAAARFAETTGNERFVSHVGPVTAAAAAGARGVLVSTAANVLASLNVRTGEPAWRVPFADGDVLVRSVLRADGALTLSATDRVVLLRKWLPGAGGALAWEHALGAPPAGSAVRNASLALTETLAAVALGGQVHVFDARDGKALAAPATGGRRVATLAAAETGKGDVFALAVPAAAAGGGSWVSEEAALLRIAAGGAVETLATYAVKDDKPRVDAGAAVVVVAGDGAAATVVAASPSGAHVHVFGSGCATGGGKRLSLKQLLPEGAAAHVSGVEAVVDPAGASAAAAFVRLALAGGGSLVLAVPAPAPTSAEAAVDASGDVATKGGAAARGACTAQAVSFSAAAAADGAVAYAAVTWAGVSHLLQVASAPSTGAVTTLAGVAFPGADGAVVVSPSALGGGADASKATINVPSPLSVAQLATLSASGAGAVGPIVAAFPLPFTKAADAGAASSSGSGGKATVRMLATTGAGHVLSFQDATTPGGASAFSSKVVWGGAQGDACVTQVLSVDVPRAGSAGAAGGDGGAGGGIASDPALGFGARLASQLQGAAVALPAAVPAALAAARDAATRALNAALLPFGRRVGGGSAGSGAANAITPGVSLGGLEKLLVMRTRLGGGGSSACAAVGAGGSGVTGVLKGVAFESGAERWSLALPASPAVRQAAAAGGGAHVDSTAVLSRPRPIQAQPAEVMLVEHAGGVTGVTWVNAHTGAVTAAVAYTAAAPLARVIRSPVLHTASHREVFVLLHADGSAAAVPGGADVAAALASVSADFVAVDLQADGAGESVVGLAFTPAAAAPVAAAAAGGAPTVPLLNVSVARLWAVRVVGGADAAAPTADERVLAMTSVAAGGAGGVVSSELVAAASGGAKSDSLQAERLIQEALAAAAADGEGGGGLGVGAGARPVQILGDDSLLLKYVNPHLVAVVAGAPGPTAGGFERGRYGGAAPAAAPAAAAGLTLFLIDGVTGRVLHTRRHGGASGPCALTRHDNWVVYTYWNARARRPEVASAALYEGAIDTYELAPWRKPAGWDGGGSRAGDVSAYGAEPPMVVHRSFVLPASVRDVTVTRTRYGVTPPQLLLTTAQDGLLALDRRMVDPRRPTDPPSKSEQAEGLGQYSPLLPLRHHWLLTGGRPVHGARLTHSAPSPFESTTLIAFLGVDHFFIRTAPAKSFDQLDPEFNSALFVLVVALGAAAAAAMRRASKRRELARAWK